MELFKKCSRCRKPKSIKKFTYDSNTKDKLCSICKDCKHDLYVKDYEVYNAARRARIKVYDDAHKDERRVYFRHYHITRDVGFSIKLGETCAICGGNRGHVHHFLSRTIHPEFSYVEENIIPLCANCHIELHRYLPSYNTYRVQKIKRANKRVKLEFALEILQKHFEYFRKNKIDERYLICMVRLYRSIQIMLKTKGV